MFAAQNLHFNRAYVSVIKVIFFLNSTTDCFIQSCYENSVCASPLTVLSTISDNLYITRTNYRVSSSCIVDYRHCVRGLCRCCCCKCCTFPLSSRLSHLNAVLLQYVMTNTLTSVQHVVLYWVGRQVWGFGRNLLV